MKNNNNKTPQGKSTANKPDNSRSADAKLKEQQESLKNSDGAGVGGKINTGKGSRPGSDIGHR